MRRRLPLSTVALWIGLLAGGNCHAGDARELLKDPKFDRGAKLLSATPGRRDLLMELKPDPKGPAPVWEIAQWASRFPHVEQNRTSTTWGNAAKTIALGNGSLTLAVNGSVEYGSRVRAITEPWVHLLAEQHLQESPPISQLQRLELALEFRVNYCRNNAEAQYDPSIHAAQLVLFLHISNVDRGSAQYGRYLHFGVPLFDNRHAVPPAHIAPDTGGTGMHIYMPSLREFTDAPVETGKWGRIHRDILPLVRRGLDDAFAKGHFGESREPAAYRITFFTLGWELPGNFDVAADLRSLSLKAVGP